MKKFKPETLITLFVPAIILLYGCMPFLWINCIEAGGNITTETRNVPDFSGIELNIPADVYITQGSPREVKITAKRGVLDQIITSVDHGILAIDYDTCVRNPDSIKIYISAQPITRLELSGSGNIYTMYGIDAQKLELKINGSGDIHAEATADTLKSGINGSGNIFLKGSTKLLEIKINGSGDIHALDAHAEKCVIKVNGSGDCEVSVEQSLEVKVNGSGDVRYKGNPAVTNSINGTGKVKKL